VRTRFVRESADVRRQALIDATSRCLAEEGIGGTSVRAICSRAGVSPGLLTHYFDGVDALIIATYRNIGVRVGRAIEAAVHDAGSDPLLRLLAFVRSLFRPPILGSELLATWISFLSQAASSPTVAAAHAEIYAGFRRRLDTLLHDAAPDMTPDRVRIAVIGLSSVIDGLWLKLCLDQSQFTAEEAQHMVVRSVLYLIRTEDQDPIDEFNLL
jgi:AcrR family transcriptional regulator